MQPQSAPVAALVAAIFSASATALPTATPQLEARASAPNDTLVILCTGENLDTGCVVYNGIQGRFINLPTRDRDTFNSLSILSGVDVGDCIFCAEQNGDGPVISLSPGNYDNLSQYNMSDGNSAANRIASWVCLRK